MPQGDLHPGPSEGFEDHREANARQQLDDGHYACAVWKRAVEQLAGELQIDPIDAHWMLMDGANVVTNGLAWEWWLP